MSGTAETISHYDERDNRDPEQTIMYIEHTQYMDCLTIDMLFSHNIIPTYSLVSNIYQIIE